MKEELAWVTYRQLPVVSNILLFKTISYASKELKSRVVLSFQNFVCIAIWSLIMYSNCFDWNLSKEQTVINLSANCY